MAKLLVIEAASDSCSIALQSSNQIFERLEAAPRMHSRLLYPMLNDVFSEAKLTAMDLDAVVFGNGPGSFTGLRIAASTAQGIGFACDIPLIGVSTLQAMAQQGFADHGIQEVICVMDARMDELYVGHYQLNDQQIMQPCIPDQICANQASLESLNITPASKQVLVCGDGLKYWPEIKKQLASCQVSTEQDQILAATAMLPMANHLFNDQQTLLPDQVELVYLREQSHWKTIKQQKQLKN